MKKHLLGCIAALIILSSCAKTYYQVYNVEGNNVKINKEAFMYEDDNCIISYNMFSDGGNVNFAFINKMDSCIYVDLSKSFYINNGSAHDYFKNRTYSYSSANSQNLAITLSNSVSAVINPGYKLAYDQASKNVSISAAKGVKTETINVYTKSVSNKEMPIVCIPPKSFKIISDEYIINDIEYTSIDLNKTPKNSISKSFDKDKAPIIFSNYITYRAGEVGNDIVIVNSFDVIGIVNVNPKKNSEFTENCRDESYNYSVKKAPNRFYIKYRHKRAMDIDSGDKYIDIY